jgi:hypothetical protein
MRACKAGVHCPIPIRFWSPVDKWCKSAAGEISALVQSLSPLCDAPGSEGLSMFINPWDMDIGGIWWAWWALGTFVIVGTGLLITARRRRRDGS